jgi:xylan 1,4-beta-xylosidase
MEDGSNLAKIEVPESSLNECPMPKIPDFDDFDSTELSNFYYAPRIMPESFADVKARPGWVRLRGQESRTSLNKVSILARKLTSVYARITTKMDFHPEVYQHSAGLILYYDNMNYINLRKYYSETLGMSALSVIQLENGEKTEFLDTRTPVGEEPVYMRLNLEGRKVYFEWSADGEKYIKIGPDFDLTKFSDEYCKYGEFTGTMVGLTGADRLCHKAYADFDFFEYIADENKNVG